MYIDAVGRGASLDEVFIRLSTGEGIVKPTWRQTTSLLRQGKNMDLRVQGRKTWKQFHKEARIEHIPTIEEASGRIVRIARSVRVFVCDFKTGQYWIEVGRGSANTDPVLKERDFTLSETLHFGESVFTGAIRAVRSELHLVPEHDKIFFQPGATEIERHSSSAYLNADSIVKSYNVIWDTSQLSEYLTGRSHIITDDGVRILLRPYQTDPADLIKPTVQLK